MQQVQAASLRLSDATAAAVLDLWAITEAGQLTEAAFRAEAAAAIATANAAGVTLADLGLAAEVTRQLRTPTNPIGLQPTAVQIDQSRIDANLTTVLTERPDTATTDELLAESRRVRLSSLARSEPLLTVAASVQVGMVRHGARGWVRMLDRDPCKVCRGWADGKVRSVDTRMARHVSCGCTQQPIFGSGLSEPERSTSQARLAAATESNAAAFGSFLDDLSSDVARRIP